MSPLAPCALRPCIAPRPHISLSPHIALDRHVAYFANYANRCIFPQELSATPQEFIAEQKAPGSTGQVDEAAAGSWEASLMSNEKTTEPQDWIQPPLCDCWFLTGPTASGKTPLALAVAQRLDAEIISLDSMAIYRGMDIGTAKPTPNERQMVRHHQLDIVDPTESYSVSNYVMDAHAAAADIRRRGHRVLVCGGTPLYLKGLLRGLFLGPAADWAFRASVEADVAAFGSQALRERLIQVDPLLAHKLHLNDHRRMIRALEVARLTGQPLSHWQQQFELPASRAECAVAVLKLDRGWLHERINTRVETMLSAGLEAEVRGLLEQYTALGQTAKQAVGYREMIDQIDNLASPAETSELIKAHTRQFARRQEIWFRGLQELQGVKVTPTSDFGTIVDQICAIFERSPQTGYQTDAT